MPPRPRTRRSSLIVHADDGIVVRRDPDRPTGRLVLLSGMEASYVDIAEPAYLEFAYLRRIRDAVDTRWPPRAELDVLHLGGAGCALARCFAATRPNTRNEVLEYDERVLAMARRVLGVHNTPRLRLRHAEARSVLESRPNGNVDVVVGDAFVDGLVPAHLATVEFARTVRRVVRSDGLYALNVVDAPPARISRRIGATLGAVFPWVAAVAPHRVLAGRGLGNIVFLSAAAPVDLDRVRIRAARDGEPTDVVTGDEFAHFTAGARLVQDGDSL